MSYFRLKLAVGLFMLTLGAVTLGLTGYLLFQKGVFAQKYHFHFTTPSAQSFKVGMPLLLSGFEVGYIDDIHLTETGQVNLRFYVNEMNRKWITENSRLMLKKPLIGSPYIEILSDRTSPLLEEGHEVEMTVSDDINDIIIKLEPTVNQLIAIVADLSLITHQISNPDGALFQTLNHLEVIIRDLKESPSFVSSLTGNPEDGQTLSDTLNRTQASIETLQQTILGVSGLVENLNETIVLPSKDIMVQVSTILTDVTLKLNTLESTVQAVGGTDQDILILKQQLLKSVEKVNQLIDKVDYMMQDENSNRLELP
ncbi:MAG: hypothetical protein CO158_07730 [Piscirickettsiaceae bacterium CG_4_9_14_3_um_filter_43_564]|nr:MCE family protein [Thiomicrospira sp.]OIP93824.1 MAG: hypothetical protein AUK56_10710 [Thiomicrospira sp. CG2_30_44_34]PIQ06437.1 MAG: hypothetical protein COW74_00650 [Piscirickettsiaceae bacterium CG18_big_fil_WC_8_21_14_2_50_44_103]PIU37820.1 MAG: hypothetical protein COT01_09585 [Piscirickettsiaceae bacterium CG07_land_8_20_14_0_80_44_28]PIW57193.1 MAG: hypothetical protein COW14_07105 [Piscirickettsiaceae bacterium CG12_big_fil_rev_8_21_14_0_65_44_934]PIW77956.1 MAG: hypothetical pro